MAHKIDNSKGFNAFVAFQEPAWHGLGTIFTEQLTTNQALQAGGLDYTVIKMPNVHNIPIINGSDTPEFIEIVSDDSFFTYRTDTNAVLGSKFGKSYEVLQNIEALNIVDEILQSGTATIETAGAIDGGKKAFICLKINKSIFVGDTDEVKQYVLIANSHDGSMAITAMPTNVRVVCNNTLTAALKGSNGAIKIRHTSNAAERLQEAAKVLKLITNNTAANEDNYNAMKAQIISKEEMFNYFGNIFLTPEEITKLQAGNSPKEVISSRKQNIMSEVLLYSQKGIGQSLATSNGNLNMWHSFNAVTGYMTAKKYKSTDQRAESLLFGSAADTIQTAGILALEPAKIKPIHKIANKFGGLNLN